jgi:protein-S-isoprenylcysteine O-methyltransferase Ste14
MQDTWKQFAELTKTPLGWLELTTIVVIGLCILAIFTSILVNFMEGARRTNVKKRKRSIVATGTMTLFFVFLYALIRFRVWDLQFQNLPLRIVCVVVGLVVIVFGCVVNIAGRFSLGHNWADQVTIYEDQELVERGMFRWVRHPLYASLIWMFYGASLVYLNAAAFLANSLIFVPFMAYRAKQEEELLLKEFSGYAVYKKKTGMFFPRWG